MIILMLGTPQEAHITLNPKPHYVYVRMLGLLLSVYAGCPMSCGPYVGLGFRVSDLGFKLGIKFQGLGCRSLTRTEIVHNMFFFNNNNGLLQLLVPFVVAVGGMT